MNSNEVSTLHDSYIFLLISSSIIFSSEFGFTFSSNCGSFLVRSGNRVVGSKYILGVNMLLEGLLPLDAIRANSTSDKLLSNLSDSMMVRNASTVNHNFVTSGIFDCLVLLDQIGSIHVLVPKSKVDIDSSTCLIDLGDSE